MTTKPPPAVAGAVGIDFGTSYSSISVGVGDRVWIVSDAQGRCLHPSIVHYSDPLNAVAGWSARDLLLAKPQQTLASPKRLLGRSIDDPNTSKLLHSMPFTTARAPDDTVLIEIGGEHYTIVQLCVPILTHLRDMAESALGSEVTQAVLSVPVTFAKAQRTALRRAAELAGLECIGFIEEPVAAAMSYGFGKDKNELVAVYDFGGGTFDFTALDVSGYSFEILGRGGDPWLGGDDFDLSMGNAIANAFWRATEIELRDRAVEWRRLLFACELAKRELSDILATNISLDRLVEYPKVINLNQPIDRPKFEALCAEFVHRSVAICEEVMEQAGIEPEDIEQVVISGGVSHIPFVHQAVEELFGRPIDKVVDPDRAIGLGAGLRAAQLSGHPVRGTGDTIGVKSDG